jgi:hypothetical protein
MARFNDTFCCNGCLILRFIIKVKVKIYGKGLMLMLMISFNVTL